MTKSYASLEQKVCPVCTKTFDSGSILLDRRLKDSMERFTTTGWDLCPDDKAKYDDGYIALVETKPPTDGSTLKPEDAYRLGRIAHIREEVFVASFNIPARNADGSLVPLMFVDQEVMNLLEKAVADG